MMGDNIDDGEEGQRWTEEEGGTHKDRRGMKEEASHWAKQHNNQIVHGRGGGG
jgi:hypothetical protein